MRRPRAVALIAMSLAGLAVLGAAAPAGAHTAAPVVIEVLRTSAPDLPPVGAPDPVSPVDPASLLLPAIVLGALVGLGIEGARRHPRRALVVGLGLLLVIFAFEDGLHSVHHGFDAKQYDECTIAAASAHLSALSVDSVLATSVVQVATEGAVESDSASPLLRLLDPHQGRAPPLAAA
jgi:hypothetical protein